MLLHVFILSYAFLKSIKAAKVLNYLSLRVSIIEVKVDDLLNKPNVTCENSMNNENIHDDNLDCEITCDEIIKVLNNMKNGKAPGAIFPIYFQSDFVSVGLKCSISI
jgi:hypothetical protein